MVPSHATLRDVECLVDERFGVGESPVWDADNDRLYWSDNTTGEVHGLELATRARRLWRFDALIGSLGLARSGRLVVAAGDTLHLLDTATGARETLARIALAPRVEKVNDGKVGPDGAFWVGTMSKREPERAPVASLYRVGADGTVERKIDGGIVVSNGLAWSADGRTMFHSCSRGAWIDAWDFDASTGAIANRRRIHELDWDTGLPDGAATDVEGGYWSAGFSAQCFNRIAADGTLIDQIAVPAAVTMPCFGGADMKTLFFTSLTDHVGPEVGARYPQNGGVFMARASVAGVPVARFAD